MRHASYARHAPLYPPAPRALTDSDRAGMRPQAPAVSELEQVKAKLRALQAAVRDVLNPGCGCGRICQCEQVPEIMADHLQEALDASGGCT